MIPKYTFTEFEEFNFKSYRVFEVLNPETTYDFSNIQGQIVKIGEDIFTVLKIDRFAHCAPWYEGERIGIVVEIKS